MEPCPSHAGLVTVVPAGLASAWHVGGGVEVLHLHLGAPVLAEVAAEMCPASCPAPASPTTASPGSRRRILDELALGEAPPLGLLHAGLLARSLAVQPLRRHAPTGTRPAPPADAAAGSKRLRRALEPLEAHLADDVSLADLAGAAHLRRRRVERVQELLARTDPPLAEVALACGFKGQSHFGQVFRRTVGVAPGRCRAGVRRRRRAGGGSGCRGGAGGPGRGAMGRAAGRGGGRARRQRHLGGPLAPGPAAALSRARAWTGTS